MLDVGMATRVPVTSALRGRDRGLQELGGASLAVTVSGDSDRLQISGGRLGMAAHSSSHSALGAEAGGLC